MTKIIHKNIEQGTPEWDKLRCGRLTASQVGLVLTHAKLQMGVGAKTQALIVAAERIKGISEPSTVTEDMERGNELEGYVRHLYDINYNQTEQCGFIQNDGYGFKFGASPDGLIIDANGGIEIKCPKAKGLLDVIVNNNIDGGHTLQMQATMLAGDLDFIDYVVYNEGMKLLPIRVRRNEDTINKIIEAGKQFEEMVLEIMDKYSRLNGIETEIAKEI